MPLPIRPIIVLEVTPKEVEKNDMVRISCRMFDKKTMRLKQVSRIFMEIASLKDGHTVWPLEVVRRNESGFDIGIGTQEMKPDQEYMIRVSNNYNLSPSATTTFKIKPSAFPILPILLPLFLSPLFLKKYADKGIKDVDGLVEHLKSVGFPDEKINDEVKRIVKDLDEIEKKTPDDTLIPDDSVRIPIDTYRNPIQKMFITQMDHRVCPRCKEHEFEVFDYDDPTAPMIPIHKNCRCTFDLIYDTDVREAGFREAARVSIIAQRMAMPLQAINSIINHNF